MIEGALIGVGLFVCVLVGAGIARWKLGRMDLFDVNDNEPLADRMARVKKDREDKKRK
ncbi:hypothetical protein [Vibrio sp. M260118]|uniref:hypothetical protein n=1 Tax=Vibrio sp. M260118 TaxID=3020896 RepID=UPI002F3E82F1